MRIRNLVILAGAALSCAPGHAASAEVDRLPELIVPAGYGAVLESHPPVSPGRPTIIHIQDADADYEAQRSLIFILEQLIAEDGLKLILVEGGQGDVGLSRLRAHGPTENRKAVAEQYLRTGRLTGEEYLDFASDHALILWGVEEPDLYRQSVSAFREAGELERMVGPALADVRQTVEQLRTFLVGDGASELERKSSRFQQRRLSAAEYAAFLESFAAKQRVSTQPYPHLRQFMDLQRLEETIALEDIPGEQRALIERLNARSSSRAMEKIAKLSEKLRTGQVTPQAFYGQLQQLAREQRVRLETYPSLSRYIGYVTLRSELNMAAVSKDLEDLTQALRNQLDRSAAAADLGHVDDELALIEQLVALKLTPTEYARLKALNLPGLFQAWATILNRQLEAAGLPVKSFGRLSLVEAGLPTLEKSYDISRRRDAALVENSLAKLKSSQARVAVLITGGSHSLAITETLKARGVGLVVIAPKAATP